MKEAGLDAVLFTKPANMFYLTGDGGLCAYAIITQEGKVALGVPSTDEEDVKSLARFDQIAGFENEVGMIHSIAHYFKHFGISEGGVGLEYTFLTQSMMGMLTHPHAKPAGVTVKDARSLCPSCASSRRRKRSRSQPTESSLCPRLFLVGSGVPLS